MLGTQKTSRSTCICTMSNEPLVLDTSTGPLHPAFRHEDFRGLKQGMHLSPAPANSQRLQGRQKQMPPLQPTAGTSIPSNLPGCYALTNRLGRAASPAKVRFVSGAKDQTVSISEHTFVSFGCTLSGITCLPRQTRSYPKRHKPAALLRGLLSPGRYLRTYRIHNSGEQLRRESPGTSVAAASVLQGAEEGAGSRFTVRLLFGFAGNKSGRLAPTSSSPNKHCIHMQSYGANDLSVVHLENRFHQPGLNDYVAAACASCCFWR